MIQDHHSFHCRNRRNPFNVSEKPENLQLSLPNTDPSDEARTSAQTTQLKQQEEILQLEPNRQAVQNGKSDYSRESSQGRRQMERSTTQMNTEIPRDTHPMEERLIDYPFAPQLRQMGINEVLPSSRRKS